jgi:enolase
VINGGKHAGQNLDFQEFQVIPASFKTYPEGLHIGVNVYKSIETILQRDNMTTLIGDEGGFAPTLGSNEDALKMLSEAVVLSNLRLGYDVFFGLDCASDNYYVDKKYKVKDKDAPLSSQDVIGFYSDLCKKYHVLYLEDALSEDDWDGWKKLTEAIGDKVQLVGDDLFVTNVKRLKLGIDDYIANSILVKVNQIGTLTETIDAVETAHRHSYSTVMSHRSG